jgi:RNA polymerase sigma factor (sigma-70 family)
VSTRVTRIFATPFAALMDHAEPVPPQSFPTVESYAFDDVPRLTAALKRGEEAAFAWLHEQWSRRINRYCFALAAGDETFAAEIAQAAWLRIVQHIRVVGDQSALWNWIACAARHAAVDLRRKGGRYRRALGRFAEWWSPTLSITAHDAADGLLSALDAAMSRLTDEERALIEARYFTGDSLVAIGARHSHSERAVEGRLARVRQRLREDIARQLQSQNL